MPNKKHMWNWPLTFVGGFLTRSKKLINSNHVKEKNDLWQDLKFNFITETRWHWLITVFKISEDSIWKSKMKLISCLTTIGLCHGEEKQNFADPMQKKGLNQLSGFRLKETYGEYGYQAMGKKSFSSAENDCKLHNGHLPIPRSGKIWKIEN